MKKKLLALLLALSMALALAACGGNNTTADTAGNNTAGNDTAGNTQQTDDGGDAAGADITIGMICIHDQNSGYDVAHIDGLTAACEALGIDVDSQVIFRYNIAEDETCEDTAIDLAEEGCDIIFSDSYGHQTYMLSAAEQYPDVTFVACTGD